nr:DUF4157 domain-containing protein [Fibrobacter succinogenes]
MSITYAQKNKNAVQTKRENSVSIIDSSSQSKSLQRKADMVNNAAQRAEAPRPNNTGMPDNLKSGIESLSGFSMDDVRVHYNSSKPATVQALAYTQGTDIHVAPGQEKHLPHEAWHVAQQMAGRVSPTTNINGMPVNDNAALEHEADVMGEKAVQCKNDSTSNPTLAKIPLNSTTKQCGKGGKRGEAWDGSYSIIEHASKTTLDGYPAIATFEQMIKNHEIIHENLARPDGCSYALEKGGYGKCHYDKMKNGTKTIKIIKVYADPEIGTSTKLRINYTINAGHTLTCQKTVYKGH